ncbi:transcription factor bHLH35 isoform X2 [Arachis hypogaea]|uniref:transcription factor bHLH35 isoform X2 n=1 Tax=Arachis hypogaea TaxID=3818 RepID=UPI0007890FBB|nr:transcription factor bHLH35 isoform X2 [Arachis hypogaea]
MEENSLTETCWFNILANDLLRWQLDGAFSGDYYDSTSPDGGASSAVSMDIVSDQNSMKQINERLFALRTAVPNVTKLYAQLGSSWQECKNEN